MADIGNLANYMEAVCDGGPDRPALVHGKAHRTWAEFNDRAARLASFLETVGAGPEKNVGYCLYNHSACLETTLASWKVETALANINYRYLPDEIVYHVEDADLVMLFFHGALAERVDEVRRRCPRLRAVVQIDDGSPLLDGALPYETVIASHAPQRRRLRSPDTYTLLYTSGTTGNPKGVMYRHGDIFGYQAMALAGLSQQPIATSLAEVERQVRILHDAGRAPIHLPAAPLMHGTGATSSNQVLGAGGCVVTIDNRHFDASAVWETVQRERVTRMAIVGDAFARPLLDELDTGRWDASTVELIISSGTVLSSESKRRLVSHIPRLVVRDLLASTEAPAIAITDSTADSIVETGHFAIGPNVAVFDDDNRPVEPGSGQAGRLALSGFLPMGYYKDPDKTARTFPTVAGRRWSIPGDYATVAADGTISLLGRGSSVVNTGGEKVFPEEVEESVKLTPGVIDCLVVGTPDDRLGNIVTAVVAVSTQVAEDDIRDTVRARLAGYKVPRRIVFVNEVPRTPVGKADYKRARELAAPASSE